jgi:hypothetical protein
MLFGKMFNFYKSYIFYSSFGICMCGPTLYNVDEELGEAHPVMIPVSSTAIPLDDLPVFKVL